MANPIPEASARIIEERDLGHCVRCGGRGGEKHHRRRRREQDSHTHEPCNVITLCRTCHDWVHRNPTPALEVGGWRLKPWANPTEHPVLHYQYGWTLLRCDGTFVLCGECENCEQIKPLEGGLCLACLRLEVCHPNAAAAAADMCGCGGGAAEMMQHLIERLEEPA